MEFTSYQFVSDSTSSLNMGSYLNSTEYDLFVQGYTSDLWYGFSSRDLIEVGVWNNDKSFVGWATIDKPNNYNEITLSYVNTLNFPTNYSYSELITNFILYKNEKILVNPPEQLSSSFGITSGSYLLSYNFTRNMAGSMGEPLVIKDISPSRTEVKLTPLFSSSLQYTAFCKKNILISDVSPLYLQSVKDCPYDKIYSQISPSYIDQINTIKNIFFLQTDGAMVNFLKNLYEDFIVYSTNPIATNFEEPELIRGNLVRIQGIRSYFTNYLISNSDIITDFSTLDQIYNSFVLASIERKFKPIGENPLPQYADAKIFVYDFFTKFFYQPISDILFQTYNNKYYSYLKNALNFGENDLLQIIDSGFLDERVLPTDPLTLLVKLKDSLPNDVSLQTKCWVSNISLAPYVVDVILIQDTFTKTFKIGPPNFSATFPDISLTNNNMSYTADDLALESSTENDRELIVSRNISELSVDYSSSFSNFIIFSSAEVRLKVFKNKMITVSNLSAYITQLNATSDAFLAASGSVYPFYSSEYTSLQGQIDDIVNTFDGYESYLYRSGNYSYSNGNFISASFVREMDLSAIEYDTTNMDSMVNNTPKHVLSGEDNGDYVLFLSMVGHFFDNIYIYIANIPSERTIGNTATEAFTRRVIDYMLQTFGWKLDDSLEQANLVNNYLTADQLAGLNVMSAEERLKLVRNRLLNNLSQIYKTKGTVESVRLLLACYGIPSSLLSIREFGGVNYNDNSAEYTAYERAYMQEWDASSPYEHFRLNLPAGPSTFIFKLLLNDSSLYAYGQEHILMGRVAPNTVQQNISASGEWAVGFIRVPKTNTAKMFFRIGYQGNDNFKIYSPEFPLFDGNIYNVMVRKNVPDPYYEFTSNVFTMPATYDLVVQRNQSGNQIIRATSSAICYNTASNIIFNGTASNFMVGGWFTDINGRPFIGALDKLQIWYDALPDANFEDYANSINAYSFAGSRVPHESLMFRMHTDYPFDLRQIPPNTVLTGSDWVGLTGSYGDWIGTWPNGNPYYTSQSEEKFSENLNILINNGGCDKIVSYAPRVGNYTPVYDSGSCKYISQSTYPYQFKIIEYPSTWDVSKYGPNKFYNEKVKYVSQSVITRFDNKGRSTFVLNGTPTPDSVQLGLFADPQDFKNKDIVRYFGNSNFMDSIGDPANQYSDNYQSLKYYRNIYAASKNEYSGSRTLFNEIITLYKLYFNRSIFDAISNLMPARSQPLVGVVIEPTILERPKYAAKPIDASLTGSYFEGFAKHYSQDPNIKLEDLSMSLLWSEYNTDWSQVSQFDQSTLPPLMVAMLTGSPLSLPNRDYPTNYGGNYIADSTDNLRYGHFSGDFLSTTHDPEG